MAGRRRSEVLTDDRGSAVVEFCLMSVLLVLLLWEDTDSAMIHRAGGLGCNVVELRPGVSLDRTFARVVGAGGR